MKELIFWVLYILTVIVVVYRFSKAFLYFNAKFKKKNTENLLPSVSVIVFLDEYNDKIESNIKQNLKKMNKSNFIFVLDVDRKDIVKQVEQLMKKMEFFNFELIEIKFNISYNKKLESALENAKDYIIVLDPYIEIESNISEILEELSFHNYIVNGLIHGVGRENNFEKIYSSFYNEHSFFGSLAIAEVVGAKRINSMFWCFKKESLDKKGILEKLNSEELEEFDLAEIVLSEQIGIFQSRVIGKCNMKLCNFSEFSDKIGREVEGYMNIIKNIMSIKVHSLVVLPIILASLTIIYSFFLGFSYVLLVLVSLLLKIIDSCIIRKFLIDKNAGYFEIFWEFISNILGIVLIFFRKSS